MKQYEMGKYFNQVINGSLDETTFFVKKQPNVEEIAEQFSLFFKTFVAGGYNFIFGKK